MATLKKLPHSAPMTPASAQPHGGSTSRASGPSTSPIAGKDTKAC